METKKGSPESELLIRATLEFVQKVGVKYDFMELDGKIILKTKDNTKAIELDVLVEKVLDNHYSSSSINSNDILDKN